MKARILEAPGAERHTYKIVATDRDTKRRTTLRDRMSHAQAKAWEPNSMDRKWWKYFKVAKEKVNA
jgi:hypothetical protein